MLAAIPAKRYFTIGEVAQLCAVKPHVLRYWEQEFPQLRPMKRRGNRRYYQRHEVLVIRRIRDLLYDQGFTISGARNQLQELGPAAFAELALSALSAWPHTPQAPQSDDRHESHPTPSVSDSVEREGGINSANGVNLHHLREELQAIRRLLIF
jgi:DNA-binding transcriptional MerR regulator